MDESLRTALTDYINQRGKAAISVTSVEIYDGGFDGCGCCPDPPSIDINYRDGANKFQTYGVFDSELGDLLLFMLKASAQ